LPMKHRIRWNAYRTASLILIVYCVLHSYGALIATPAFGQSSDAVLASMRAVHFSAQGFNDSWYGFYLGFGWFVSVFLASSAAQLWIIGERRLTERHKDRAIVGVMAVAYAIGVWLCTRYLFPAALIFSAAVLLAILWGLISDAVALSQARNATSGT
jgi:hypothetical protein